MEDHKKSPPSSAESAEQELLELEELLERSAVSHKKAETEHPTSDDVDPGAPLLSPEAVELEEDLFEPAPSQILDFDFSDMDELQKRAGRSQFSEQPEEEDFPAQAASLIEEGIFEQKVEQDAGQEIEQQRMQKPEFIAQGPSSPQGPPRPPTPEPIPEPAPAPPLELEPEFPSSPEQPSRLCDPTGHFSCDPLPRYSDFIFQNSKGRFLFSGASVHLLDQGDPVAAYCPLVVDFFGSPGPGVLLVEGAHKYAPVLGRRKLQQQGEITDEFLLHPMQSLKVSKNETSLFYHLVPRAEQTALLKESESSPEGFLLHDTVTMLHGLLKNMTKEGPAALALHLSEAVLVVAGDRTRVAWARRYTLAGDDMSALRDGFEIIAQDMRNVRRDCGIHIREVIWVESLVRTLEWPEYSSEELHFTRMPVFAMQDEEGAVFSALPGLISRMGTATALTEPAERMLVGVGRWEKVLLSLLLVVCLMAGGAGYWLEANTVDLNVRKLELTSQKNRLQREYSSVSSAIGFLKEDSERAVEAGRVAEQVGRAGRSAPLAGIWNSLAELRPKPCRVQALEVTYEKESAKIRIEGVVDLGLTQAQAAYSGFLTALDRGGFKIRQQSFQLDVDSNFFSLVLEKGFSE